MNFWAARWCNDERPIFRVAFNSFAIILRARIALNFQATRQYPWHKRNGGLDSSRWSPECLCKNVLQFTPSAFRNRAAILSMLSLPFFSLSLCWKMFRLFVIQMENVSVELTIGSIFAWHAHRSHGFTSWFSSLIFISIHMKFNGNTVNQRINESTNACPTWTLCTNVESI